MNYIKGLIQKTKRFYLAIACCSFLSLISGCKDTINNEPAYLAEADAICKAFDPVFWSTAREGLQAIEISELLSERLSSALKSEEMDNILTQMNKVPMNERYEFYRQSVAELTGTDIVCPALDDYFSI